ncbi:Aluminum-activated malate transporter [Corchorus olitorius]|uniref:Aluminum-activated malate transporter n=1 Tax=Corchorus olitorius TaxID=93759 RepID=A0A1R3K9S6_9ROSI|nr:Aluminum-activated malate transporter [Corchorus olitorius]
MEGASPANQGNSSSRGQWLKALPSKLNAKVMEIAWKARQLGKEDPRRVYHSLKVGLALTLITIFYYFKPVYDYGENAMWAILTVVLVLEFSVGATLGKGLNRMFATLTGGALGIVTHRIATLSGKIGEPILISTFVFIMAAIATFMKFFPNLKASVESSKALKELASTMEKMTRERSADVHMASSKTAAEELKNLLKTSLWEEEELLQILPAASIAYLLLEIVECIEKIAAAVYELANEASFKHIDTTLFHRGAVQPVANNNVDASLETIITVA